MLKLLQLLTVIKCSGILCTVNQCSVKQITAICLHFNCTFNVTICSVGVSFEGQSWGSAMAFSPGT